jgi:hypothetical protein
MMEHYQLTDNLDPSLKQQNQSKTDKDESKKLMEKPNDKKCKGKLKKNDSEMPAPKMNCMIHGSDSSQMTDKCHTLQEQAYQMKEAWKNMSPAKCSHQKCKRKQQNKEKN